ncbi:hypothetical protein [Bacillus alkalicellulosilyticus]|uniref:hypothetical protein n=1 Tax=Alkalihalobacterium alkalicellulosilyticum TaxID=1912214 RepID=UPI000997930F|nr:hypothetical protein [Bacillus alkalicellulosilyticus]
MKKKAVIIVSLSCFVCICIWFFVLDKQEKTFATWVWDSQLLVHEHEAILSFSEQQNIGALYVQIDQTLPFETYQSFIALANEKNINVFALDGAPEWIHTPEWKDLLAWIYDYSATSNPNQQFTGIHLDIEPYLLPDWEENPEQVILDFQTVIQHVSTGMPPEMEFELAVPFWFSTMTYDNRHGMGSLGRWLVQSADQLSVMTYRTDLLGENGLIELFDPFLQLAKEENKKVRIAIETIEIDNERVSFYYHHQSKLDETIRELLYFYKKQSHFTGIDVHHYQSWRDLLEREQ